MTTDTHPKQAAAAQPGRLVVGGMAKGAGMLAPGLATMLCVITTDAVADRRPTRHRPARGHRAPPSTGSTSTAARPPTTPCCCWPPAPPASRPTDAEFTALLTAVCADLVHQLQADAEGATKEIAIEVRGAATEADAVEVGRTVAAEQPGQDCALFGTRPELGPGRLAAVARRGAAVRPRRARTSPSTASGLPAAACRPRTASEST